MTKATDKELGELHALVARTFVDALSTSDEAKILLEASVDQEWVLPPAIEDFLEKAASVNPALLTAAAKFLKDNNVTCALEDSEDQDTLKKRLAAKRKHSVGNVVTLPIEEDKDFE